MKKLILLIFICSSLQAKNFLLEKGIYYSNDNQCGRKHVVYIKRETEHFYLIGQNQRFLTFPEETKTKELRNECAFIHTSQFKNNMIIQQETELPCIRKSDGSIKKDKKTTTSKLKLLSNNEFELEYDNQPRCRYIKR